VIIKLPFTCSDTIYINSGNTVLTTFLTGGTYKQVDYTLYNIPTLVINAEANYTENIRIEGLTLRGLIFNASAGYYIKKVTVEGCVFIRTENADDGIVFIGDGTTNGYCDMIRFRDCEFGTSTWAQLNDGAAKGFFSWTDCRYCTAFAYTNCRFNLCANNISLFYFDNNSDAQLTFDGCFLYTSLGKIGHKIFYCKGNDEYATNSPMVYWLGGHWEWHSTGVFYTLDNGGGGDNRLVVEVIGCSIGASGYNITMFNITETQFYPNSLVSMISCRIASGISFSLGTLPTDTDVTKEIKFNAGYITENKIGLSNVSNGTHVAHDLAGTPNYVIITLSVKGYAWYGTINATHVQIYASVATINGTMYCEFKP